MLLRNFLYFVVVNVFQLEANEETYYYYYYLWLFHINKFSNKPSRDAQQT